MSERRAPAKLNLALVVGPKRPDGKHAVTTVLQRITLADTVTLEPGDGLDVEGYEDDTIVRQALEQLAARAGRTPSWRVRIEKRIPVAAGLGGGSTDAAAALHLANETLPNRLATEALHELAASIGADVPFFLTEGPQLGEGDGTTLGPLDLPQDYWIDVIVPHGERKASTASVYEAFTGHDGFPERRAAVLSALAIGDLAALPPNDLASSPLAEELRDLGAFRADVSGAGPAVYGLFADESQALTALAALDGRGETWIAAPAW